MSAADEGRSIGKLVAEATEQVSDLMRAEITLMKAELQQDIRRGSVGAIAGAVAGVLALLALLPLTLALGFWLHAWWDVPLAIAFLIVGGIYLLLAAIGGLVAMRVFKKLPPRDRVASLKETAQVFSSVKPHPAHTPTEGDRLKV